MQNLLTFPATSTTLATLSDSGLGTDKSKGCLGSGWIHAVVSSSHVVFHHCIIPSVIVCSGLVVAPGVCSVCMCFSRAQCSFFHSMHVIPLLTVCHLVCFNASP